MPAQSLLTGRGEPLPLGLTQTAEGYNLAVFSRHATGVSMLIFEVGNEEPAEVIAFDPAANRSGDVWHLQLGPALRGKSYVLRVEGPWFPEQGHRFDPRARLIDPYAVALIGAADWQSAQQAAFSGAPHPACSARALVVDHAFDWQGDAPLRHPWSDTVIYETHVRGLTAHSSACAVHPGSYLGLVEKIPYLHGLGVTAVELMPVQEFCEFEAVGANRPLRNYWGYNPVALFAPKAGYASRRDDGAVLTEFRTMVRELHRAGIEVILDVVFNHTAEGNENGPTFCFRGLDNRIYYMLEAGTGRYIDYTGCGNTLNCNHPVVRAFIVDCLRHWVTYFHVDGFRFDLASILGRDTEGRLLSKPPLLEQIAEDPILRHTKLIAEAWDLGGAFQVGNFPGRRWAEWNSKFRDEVRRFWRGDQAMTGAFATRLAGSADLYQSEHESPVNSINFVTCHDGFTLNDLVSYARKHNEDNGEGNRDGIAESYSENNGTEGPSDDSEIEAVRLRQIKNFLLTLMVSRGVPMLLGGDEFRRTQQGNNNAYCQDNEISWYDWRLIERHDGLVRFVTAMIRLRKDHPVLSAERFYTDADIRWLGSDGRGPEWHGRDNRIGAVIFEQVPDAPPALCLLFNAALSPCRFVLPALAGAAWRLAVDTGRESPHDIFEPGAGPTVHGDITLSARSAVILTSR